MANETLEAAKEIDLGTLNVGETLHANETEKKGLFSYEFRIIELGERPICDLTQTGPDGSLVGPAPVILEGTGHWTTPAQNPTQRGDPLMGKPHQWEAMTISWGRVSVGGLLVFTGFEDKKRGDRYYLMPATTELKLVR